MNISKRYNPADVEQKWYQHWSEKGYFHSKPDEREKFSVVIPPPNVTGVLHMGHILNNTIQDALVRKARLDGKNACWVPGTDHASIATEAKVVRWLREKGIKKGDLTRDQFLNYAHEWKDKYGGIILDQLKKLGASCDWDREAFTMDEVRSRAVIKSFVDLYHKGKLYRDYRMVNWDPEAQTVLSNEEVIYKEEKGKLYFVRYIVEGSQEHIVIATTRPETILADTAIAVNPQDERYASVIGKKVRVPLSDRVIEVIVDDYVDKEFGTGALKITPAHDTNDYEIGKKHKLETISIINADGTMSENTGKYAGLDRFVARKQFVVDLEEGNLLEKVEDYVNSVGRSERTNSVVEPRLSLQWYVDMSKLVKPALDAVLNEEIKFYPKSQVNTYKHWMGNIQDWCISRQLWWGHRIPVWYYDGDEYVAETAEEALYQVQANIGKHNLTLSDLEQDEDVLDTWFSSWLWPISVFDGFEEKSELHYYYPTDVVVTGWDIIFLWIARMIMAGYEWEEQKPFKHVYFTGMVRDAQRRKMSKSLGNSPDILKLIETYGADGVRFGMLSSSPAGGDVLYDEKLVIQGRNFCNKMWNALRLIKGFEIDEHKETPLVSTLAVNWIHDKFHETFSSITKDYEQFRISNVLKKLYIFVKDDFSGWFLEMVKPIYGEKIDHWSYDRIIEMFEIVCKLLHPFMPFITEEIYHELKERKVGDDIMISRLPKQEGYDSTFLDEISTIMAVISAVRELRNSNGISPNDKLQLAIMEDDSAKSLYEAEGRMEFLEYLGNVSVNFISTAPESSKSFVVNTEKYFLEFPEEKIDIEAELVKVREEIEYTKGFIASVKKKLNNENFVNRAPKKVVENEKQKLEDGEERLKKLEESLVALRQE